MGAGEVGGGGRDRRYAALRGGGRVSGRSLCNVIICLVFSLSIERLVQLRRVTRMRSE